MHLQVFLNHTLQPGVEVLAQRPLLQEDLAQGFVFLQHPGVHGPDEGVSRDEVHLQGEDAEQQVAVGKGLRHGLTALNAPLG